MTAQCPVCLRSIDVREEKAALRAEWLCPACGALLSVLSRQPLELIEVDLTGVPEED
jgi:hypothetical protein